MAPPGRRGGKFSKPTRGGGKHFSRDLQPLDKDGVAVGMWRDPNDPKAEDSDEETSSEESSEEESEDDAGPSQALGNTDQDMTREQRKEAARKKKLAAIAKKNKKVAEVGDMPTSSEDEDEDEDEDLPANPNHSSKARAQAQAPVVPAGETPSPGKKEKDNLSRREREAVEKEAARERYQKLHAEGKTDEARADLARLKLIRQQREEAAARKQAEAEEKAEETKKREAEIEAREAKLKAAAMGDAASKGSKKTRGKK